jgi:hypothetical protein
MTWPPVPFRKRDKRDIRDIVMSAWDLAMSRMSRLSRFGKGTGNGTWTSWPLRWPA